MAWLQVRSQRLLFVGVVSLGAAYLWCILAVVAHRRQRAALSVAEMSDANATAPGLLPDLGAEFVGRLHAPGLAEFWLTTGSLLTALRFFWTQLGKEILRRWLTCLSALYLLAGVCRILDVAPQPTGLCDLGDSEESAPTLTAALMLLLMMSSCENLEFSLRVCNLILCALVWFKYSEDEFAQKKLGIRSWRVRVAVSSYVIIGVYLILATRVDYSSNVYVWSIVSVFIWFSYHMWIVLLRVDQFHLIGGDRLVPYNVLARFALWLEDGAKDLHYRPALASESKTRKGSIPNSMATHGSVGSFEDDPEYDRAFEQSALGGGAQIVFDNVSPVVQNRNYYGTQEQRLQEEALVLDPASKSVDRYESFPSVSP